MGNYSENKTKNSQFAHLLPMDHLIVSAASETSMVEMSMVASPNPLGQVDQGRLRIFATSPTVPKRTATGSKGMSTEFPPSLGETWVCQACPLEHAVIKGKE